MDERGVAIQCAYADGRRHILTNHWRVLGFVRRDGVGPPASTHVQATKNNLGFSQVNHHDLVVIIYTPHSSPSSFLNFDLVLNIIGKSTTLHYSDFLHHFTSHSFFSLIDISLNIARANIFARLHFTRNKKVMKNEDF